MLPRLGPLNRKDEQRLKDERAERKNWLLLEPGELQRKREQESTLGVANNPINGLDKEEHRTDYTFYGVGDKKSSQRQPGEIRAIGQGASKEELAEGRQATQQQRAREDAEEESRRSDKKFELTGSVDAQSAHTANELRLDNLLDPAQKDAASAVGASKEEFSLKSLMGSASTRTKEQQARMDVFNNLLNPQGSLSLPVTAGPSLGSVAPGFAPKLPESSVPKPAPSGDGLGFGQNGASRVSPPGLPTFNNNPGFNPSSPFDRPQMPAANDAGRNSWLKPVEPVRRKF